MWRRDNKLNHLHDVDPGLEEGHKMGVKAQFFAKNMTLILALTSPINLISPIEVTNLFAGQDSIKSRRQNNR